MPFYSLNKHTPKLVGSGHFIAPNASIIGNVTLMENVSVWFNVVLRGDNDNIIIGANSNIQDGSVCHVDPNMPLIIGENVTCGHKVILHGCTVGNNCLVGMNAVLMDNVEVGNNCIIGANTLLTEGTKIPDNSLVLGSPGKVVKTLSDAQREFLPQAAKNYVANGKKFNESLQLTEPDYE